jgi:hypothetical protein
MPTSPSENSEAAAMWNERNRSRGRHLLASRNGIRLAAVTSIFLIVGFGISKYQGDFQMHSLQPEEQQPRPLRVSENADTESTAGISNWPAVVPSPERPVDTSDQATIRISASSRQHD